MVADLQWNSPELSLAISNGRTILEDFGRNLSKAVIFRPSFHWVGTSIFIIQKAIHPSRDRFLSFIILVMSSFLINSSMTSMSIAGELRKSPKETFFCGRL